LYRKALSGLEFAHTANPIGVSDKGMIIALSHFVLVGNYVCLNARDPLKQSQKEIKEFGSKEPNLCQTRLHWIVRCASDMSSAGLVN
jgi:hypothetical protein